MIFILGGRKGKLAGVLLFACVMLLFTIFFTDFSGFIAATGSNELRPIYKVGITEKKVAISFDACWGAEYTDDILAKLDEYNIKTTFFLVNIWLKDYPDVAKEIVKQGHEIGLHSTTHPHFSKLSEEDIKKELKDNHEMIAEITGFQPTVFRPPFGDYNSRLIEISNSLGYDVIQWDVDSLDWKDLSAEEIYDRVIKRVEPGSIVLFHNNGKHTAEALEPIIKTLKAQDFEIVPVSKLLLPGEYYVDHQGTQKAK
ncbi:polysaccharide deacetylase family protein [Metallumcola ferriviriculae]|uniref:Polysaccharide deacetylase family protein n=1 Tax=Metallumcola ferriviriculae TaxID=3039180 RepID=A0AAU0UK43_9FIRM|nr:polysaccharide deacetylase family protein [Desulfitibacteraceae bacterium MK1]